MTKLFATFLALACVAGAAEPDRKESGFLLSGPIIPHYASGSDKFSTEFQIMGLMENPVPFVMNIFNSAGEPQDLELRDSSGAVVNTGSVHVGIIPAGGIVRLVTPFAGSENKSGYVTFDTPEFGTDIGLQAVITSFSGGVAQFRTAIPGLTTLTLFTRVPFTEMNGLFSGVGLVSFFGSTVTVVANGNDGVELCRTSFPMPAGTHTAFLLRDILPCTGGTEGTVEISNDAGVVLLAIGLIFDEQLRMWTSLPFGICCFDPQ